MSNKKKEIRRLFRESVFSRDHNRCATCSEEGELDAHHIIDRTDMPNGGYVKENGISLCKVCHDRAEEFHRTGGQRWIPGFHPDDLYRRIGSNEEKAREASSRLG